MRAYISVALIYPIYDVFFFYSSTRKLIKTLRMFLSITLSITLLACEMSAIVW